MFELVYCSEAVPNLKEEDVNAILEVAIDFNTSHNITGCLVLHKGQFLQILEGDEQHIRELYGRIQIDKRHSNVELLSTNYKENRTFAAWGMAYCASEQEIEQKLFEENMKSFYDFADKPSGPIRIFWSRVAQILDIND